MRLSTLPHLCTGWSSQKLEFCSYFCPKKCPSFACTFTKMSLSEGFGTLPFQTFLWTLPSDSYWFIFQNFPYTLGEKSKSVSFSRVYVCVKVKLTLVSFLSFFLCTFPLCFSNAIVLSFLSILQSAMRFLMFWRRSSNMRVSRLHFLCVSWWRCQASQLWWCGLHFQRQRQWFLAVTRKQNSGTNHSHISECKGGNNWRLTTHKHMTLFEDPPRYDPFYTARLGYTHYFCLIKNLAGGIF